MAIRLFSAQGTSSLTNVVDCFFRSFAETSLPIICATLIRSLSSPTLYLTLPAPLNGVTRRHRMTIADDSASRGNESGSAMVPRRRQVSSSSTSSSALYARRAVSVAPRPRVAPSPAQTSDGRVVSALLDYGVPPDALRHIPAVSDTAVSAAVVAAADLEQRQNRRAHALQLMCLTLSALLLFISATVVMSRNVRLVTDATAEIAMGALTFCGMLLLLAHIHAVGVYG